MNDDGGPGPLRRARLTDVAGGRWRTSPGRA
jgi:hypothetical protein